MDKERVSEDQKKTEERGAHLVLLDESGYRLMSTLRKTYAPIGDTPIVKAWDRHDRITAIGAIIVSPVRKTLGLSVELLADDANATARDTIRFMESLRGQIRRPMTILWDGSNIHDKSREVRDYLDMHPEIVVERFPAYAPELNPEEYVWEHSKHGKLANHAPKTTSLLRIALAKVFDEIRKSKDLLASFLRHSGLPLLE